MNLKTSAIIVPLIAGATLLPLKLVSQERENIKKDLIENMDEKRSKEHFKIVKANADSMHIEKIRKHILIEINHIRDSLGSKGQLLVLNENINNCAQEYAEYIYNNKHFSHTDLEGKDVGERLKKHNINIENTITYAENLARGQRTIEKAIDVRLVSNRHRFSILLNYMTDVGIGYHKGYRVLILTKRK